MTDWSADFIVKNPELFPRRLNDVVADLVRKRWPKNTAKMLAGRWRMDPKTGESVAGGHVGIVSLSKGIQAEGWELLEAIGHAMTGQTYAEWQEAILTEKIKEAEHARTNVTRLRARAEALAAIASGGPVPDAGRVDDGLGLDDDRGGRAARRVR